ncbi:MAG: prepilin peptidase [Acidobacteria bacterium]|nr:prepilin peptidase [Acidobacteriota bacterium]
MSAADIDEGIIIPDRAEPWLPKLARPWAAVPTGVGAIVLGSVAFTAHAGENPLLGVLAAVTAAIAVVLAVVDAMTTRLPDVLVGSMGGFATAVLLVSGIIGVTSWATVAIAFASMAGVLVIFWLLAFLVGGLGMGDVKYATVLALVLGVWGPYASALGSLILPFALAGPVALVVAMASRSITGLPLGPALSAGAMLIIVFPHLSSFLAFGQ